MTSLIYTGIKNHQQIKCYTSSHTDARKTIDRQDKSRLVFEGSNRVYGLGLRYDMQQICGGKKVQ